MKHTDISCLIELYGKKIYNFCLRLCGNTYDAEDLYQETFLKAMEKISVIDEDNNPSAYLCSIALSLYKSKVRKAARRHAIAPTVSIDDATLTAQEKSFEEDILSKELFSEIKTAVSQMDEKLRVCVILHYVASLPLGEIARITRLPEGTVKSRLFTARKLLKEKFVKGAQL